MKQKTIVLIRHGETAWNAEKRWQGHVDIPLNEAGREQAKRVGRELAGEGLELLLSSDLLRARQTAELVNDTLSIPIRLSKELREVHVGEAEGFDRDDVLRRFGEEALEAWGSIHSRDLGFAFPGGEPKRNALERVSNYLTKFLQDCPQERIGVVSHGMLLRLFLHELVPWVEEPIKIMNCDYFRLGYEADSGRWEVPAEWDRLSRACS